MIWQYNWWKALYHLDWNANDSSWNWYNWTATNVTWIWGKIWSWSGNFTGWTSVISIWWNIASWFTAITISGWFNVPNNTWWSWKEKTMISHRWTVDSFACWMNLNATWQLFFRINWSNDVSISWLFNANTRYNYLCTWVSWWKMKIYLNWKMVAQSAWNVTYTIPNWTAYMWRQWDWWFNAPEKLDEIIIDNKAWTETEIKKYYTYSKWYFNI